MVSIVTHKTFASLLIAAFALSMILSCQGTSIDPQPLPYTTKSPKPNRDKIFSSSVPQKTENPELIIGGLAGTIEGKGIVRIRDEKGEMVTSFDSNDDGSFNIKLSLPSDTLLSLTYEQPPEAPENIVIESEPVALKVEPYTYGIDYSEEQSPPTPGQQVNNPEPFQVTSPDGNGIVTITADEKSFDNGTEGVLINIMTGETVTFVPETNGSATARIRASHGDTLYVFAVKKDSPRLSSQFVELTVP